jgi:hypothetical protein
MCLTLMQLSCNGTRSLLTPPRCGCIAAVGATRSAGHSHLALELGKARVRAQRMFGTDIDQVHQCRAKFNAFIQPCERLIPVAKARIRIRRLQDSLLRIAIFSNRRKTRIDPLLFGPLLFYPSRRQQTASLARVGTVRTWGDYVRKRDSTERDGGDMIPG